MPNIKINAIDFWRGVSTSDFLADGGYSPAEKGHNLYVKKGLLYPQPLEINKGSLAGDGIIASSFNNDLSPDFSAVVSTNSDDGKFYTFTNAGVPTLVDTDTGKNYSDYKTDMIFYNGSFFISSSTNITKLTSAMGSFDNDWWTAVAGGATLNSFLPHQLLEFNNVMYITDTNLLRSWDGAAKNNSAIDLPTNFKITAIVVYQNKIYMAAETNFNASGTQQVTSKLFSWDGSASSFDKEFKIPEKIFTMIDYRGMLFLFGKYSLYFWNGISFVNVFDLPDISKPVYKQMITIHKDRMYFVNGDYVICYDGERFSYLYDSNNASTDISGQPIKSLAFTSLINNENQSIMTGNDDSYLLDLENNAGATASTGVSKWLSNRYELPQNIRITFMTVELSEDLVSGSELVFFIIDERNNETEVGSMLYSKGDRRVKEFYNINLFALSFQLKVEFKTNAKPIRTINITYEGVGNRIKQA